MGQVNFVKDTAFIKFYLVRECFAPYATCPFLEYISHLFVVFLLWNKCYEFKLKNLVAEQFRKFSRFASVLVWHQYIDHQTVILTINLLAYLIKQLQLTSKQLLAQSQL